METTSTIIIVIIGIFIILMNIKNKPYTLEDHENDIMKNYNEERWINYQKETDEKNLFTHPVTGYRGTASEMDAYITNRERKIKNDNG